MNTRLTDCKQCGARIVKTTDQGLTTDCDITPLTPREHAQAWIDHRHVYTIQTHGARMIWIRPSYPAPISQPRLIALLKDNQHVDTVLTKHQCPAPLICDTDALDRWMPKDRNVIAPQPVKAVKSEGVPF